MEFSRGYVSREGDIIDLFTATFTASEGPTEGVIIQNFVSDLIKTTPDQDLIVWCAYEDRELVGCIVFSRMVFAQDDRSVFILSPVAVKTDRQNKNVGQRLITHGLDNLRDKGVDIVLTYGDPNYYSKTGFKQISEETARAPLKLNHPEGWLGQSLDGMDEWTLIGPSSCVPALNEPELW